MVFIHVRNIKCTCFSSIIWGMGKYLFSRYIYFSQLFWDIIDICYYVSLGVQHNDLTYVYCEMTTTIILVLVKTSIISRSYHLCVLRIIKI